MPVIEAQRTSILVPHDHRHINQMRATPPVCWPLTAAAGTGADALAYCGSNPLSPRPTVLSQRLAGILAERIDPDEAQQPGVLLEQAD